MNRLKLDFQISSAKDRKAFIDKYLEEPQFKKSPPTNAELETMANYMLYGRDEDGKNVEQRKEIQIDRKRQTWVQKKEESLDSLLENPAFNESSFCRPTEVATHNRKEKFSRSKMLRRASPFLREVFVDLFKQIDTIDLQINFSELASGKRTKPPRSDLLNKFTDQEIKEAKEIGENFPYYTYLKKRHELVQLRTKQYELREGHFPTIRRKTFPSVELEQGDFYFGVDLPVLPLGLYNQQPAAKLIFKRNPSPTFYSEKELETISSFYWKKNNEEKELLKHQKDFFDFRELEHVYELLGYCFELQYGAKKEIESTTNSLITTLYFYISIADLTDVQKEILKLRIRGVKNQDIANEVNPKYGKSYTANYISTIFRHKIIKEINRAAAQHNKVISLIFFPEEFKVCTMCNETLLRNADNFVRKARSKDGFSSRCKRCDRVKRQERKERR